MHDLIVVCDLLWSCFGSRKPVVPKRDTAIHFERGIHGDAKQDGNPVAA